jgi:cytochrome c oxidase cbb3-type subunit 2
MLETITNRSTATSLKGILHVGAVLFYFLIFAQFAFLKELEHLFPDTAGNIEKILGIMGLAGIAGSFLHVILPTRNLLLIVRRLRLGFALSAAAAFASIYAQTFFEMCVIAAATGLGTGFITVGIAANLDTFFPRKNRMLLTGFAVGLAYLCANIPLIFQGTPTVQSLCAGLCICLPIFFPINAQSVEPDVSVPLSTEKSTPFGIALLMLTILIVYDSGIFFVIQKNPLYRSETWGSTSQLWENGGLHLMGAIASGWLLSRFSWRMPMIFSFVLLVTATRLLHTASLTHLAHVLYVTGVSLYSVPLVALCTHPEMQRIRPSACWKAALFYSIAGWIGSAVGIAVFTERALISLPFVWICSSLFILAIWLNTRTLRHT